MVAGLAVSIGFSGIRYRKDTGFIFEQARYLLPLLPLYAAGVALAALGAGRRLRVRSGRRSSCSRWATACSPSCS